MLSSRDENFDKLFQVRPWSVSLEAKRIYCVFVTDVFLYHSRLIWLVREFTVWAQYVEVACKVVVWHLVKSSKKNNEVHMVKENELYPCVVTNVKYICAQYKQKILMEFSQDKKTST